MKKENDLATMEFPSQSQRMLVNTLYDTEWLNQETCFSNTVLSETKKKKAHIGAEIIQWGK
jgi:hypothetical protein